MLPLTATLLACAAAPGPDPGAGAAADDSGAPGDGGGIEAPVPAPEWTAAQAAEAAEAALATGLPSPVALRGAWRDLVDAGQDGTCPGPDEMSEPDLEGCTSAEGYTYQGLAVVDDREASGTDQDWLFTADFEIRDPDGRAYEAGGSASHYRFHEGGGVRTFLAEVRGSWRQDGAGGWLEAGTSAMLRVDGVVELTRTVVTLDGSATVQGVSMDFAGVELDDTRCEGHPEGRMAVRDPSGGWFELDFGEGCDGCAAATFAGDDVGEVCLDLREAALTLAEEVGG